MDWVRDFYAMQDAWLGAYSGPLSHRDQKHVATAARLAGARVRHVREAGAGGGQTAAALAGADHDLTAIELVPTRAAHGRERARVTHPGPMTVIEGAFYQASLSGALDVIWYWHGFGIGDDDQRRLLTRIASWLTQDGCAASRCYRRGGTA